MSIDAGHMRGLVALSGLTFRSAQSEMADIQTREAALRLNLAQLTQSKAKQAKAVRRSDEAALIAGADLRWHHWVDQRRATINTELAQVLALKENCRSRLQIAFGRDQVAASLLQQMVRSDQTQRRRRADYVS